MADYVAAHGIDVGILSFADGADLMRSFYHQHRRPVSRYANATIGSILIHSAGISSARSIDSEFLGIPLSVPIKSTTPESESCWILRPIADGAWA